MFVPTGTKAHDIDAGFRKTAGAALGQQVAQAAPMDTAGLARLSAEAAAQPYTAPKPDNHYRSQRVDGRVVVEQQVDEMLKARESVQAPKPPAHKQ